MHFYKDKKAKYIYKLQSKYYKKVKYMVKKVKYMVKKVEYWSADQQSALH